MEQIMGQNDTKWEFVWLGRVKKKRPIMFALKNLWQAMKGYELTILQTIKDPKNSPAQV
jgi:hypothetical protein